MSLLHFSGTYHKASEPAPGVLLLEFNRYVNGSLLGAY
jgi:hypothetical protein